MIARGTLALLAGALLAGALGLYTAHRLGLGTPPVEGAARIGDPAPELRLADLQGVPHRLGPGRPRLLNYWASWCAPCLEELPMLDRFASEQGANGVEVVGIALDDPTAVRAFLARTPVRFRMLQETPGPEDSSVKLGNVRKVLPFSVLIGADGRISRLRVGPFKGPDDLRSWAGGD